MRSGLHYLSAANETGDQYQPQRQLRLSLVVPAWVGLPGINTNKLPLFFDHEIVCRMTNVTHNVCGWVFERGGWDRRFPFQTTPMQPHQDHTTTSTPTPSTTAPTSHSGSSTNKRQIRRNKTHPTRDEHIEHPMPLASRAYVGDFLDMILGGRGGGERHARKSHKHKLEAQRSSFFT